MDDGAATIIAKNNYIDKGVYYPESFWKSSGLLKYALKSLIYRGLFEKEQLDRSLFFASAFLKDESDFNVDFSFLKERFLSSAVSGKADKRKVYFFGSKYSETGVISRDYELSFISGVKDYYSKRNIEIAYFSHRDESKGKLHEIKRLYNIEVISSDFPAELFILDYHKNIAGIAAAYSSVINNLSLIFPDIPVKSFRLSPYEINPKYRVDIDAIYKVYEERGVVVERICRPR